MSAQAAAVDGMRSRVLRGLVWKASSQIILQASRIVTAIILARLLAPHSYGLAGMVLVFTELVMVFADLALGAALVQRRLLTEADRSTAFWTSVVGGLLFTLIGVGLAGPVASFYGEPAVKPLFAAMSLGFLITSVGATQSALLTREMNFRSLELRRIGGVLAGAVVGIVLATRGAGAWAIIAQQLTLAVVSTVLLWAVTPWRPRFKFSRASLRTLGGFSGNVLGTRLLFYANRNADNLLIGRFIGPKALGAYAISYNVMLVPFDQIASPIQEVLFPAFARIQDQPERMATAWYRVNRIVGAISIPALLGLIVVAPDFVPVVLGNRWSIATPVIQILAWVGLLQSLQRLNSSILQARNKTGTLFRYSVVVLVASLIAFVAGLHWGIVGVATGYAVSSTLVEPYYTWITARALNVSVWSFFRSLTGVVQAAAAMVVVVLVARHFLQTSGFGAGGRLAILVALGLAVYVPLALWWVPELLAEVRDIRRRRVAVPEAPPTSP